MMILRAEERSPGLKPTGLAGLGEKANLDLTSLSIIIP